MSLAASLGHRDHSAQADKANRCRLCPDVVLKNPDVRGGLSVKIEEEVVFLWPPLQTQMGDAKRIRLGTEELCPLSLG